jgi:D-alanyl-D-alanine carboxypeptidase
VRQDTVSSPRRAQRHAPDIRGAGHGQRRGARKRETRSLLNYGFRFYDTETAVEGGEELAKPRVWKGMADYLSVGAAEDLVLTLPRGKRRSLLQELTLEDPIRSHRWRSATRSVN